jgi:hypothetical protein
MKQYGKLNLFDDLSLEKAKLLKFLDGDSSNFAAIKAPATLSADYTLTLPANDGAADQVLSTDGSGVLSWVDALTDVLATNSILVGIAGAATPVDTAAQGDVAATSAGLTLKASVAGAGLALTSGVLSVNVDASTIEINSDTLRVKDAGITNAKVATGIDAAKLADGSVSNTEFQYLDGVTSAIQTQLNARTKKFAVDWLLADGASLVVNHALATKDVVVEIYDKDDDSSIAIDSIVRTDTNNVTVTASQAPAVAWRVVVIG